MMVSPLLSVRKRNEGEVEGGTPEPPLSHYLRKQEHRTREDEGKIQ